jgi:hypothetical protein
VQVSPTFLREAAEVVDTALHSTIERLKQAY